MLPQSVSNLQIETPLDISGVVNSLETSPAKSINRNYFDILLKTSPPSELTVQSPESISVPRYVVDQEQETFLMRFGKLAPSSRLFG